MTANLSETEQVIKKKQQNDIFKVLKNFDDLKEKINKNLKIYKKY